MSEQLLNFLESPNREDYLELRDSIISSDAYDPYSDELDSAYTLYEQQRYKEAQSLLQESMKNLMLSPSAHLMLGLIHSELGDERAAQMEYYIGHACINGILATGDGSEKNPFHVLRTSDEYDLLDYYEKEPKQQSLIHHEDKHFDLIECTDGTEYWFDITVPFEQLEKKFGQ